MWIGVYLTRIRPFCTLGSPLYDCKYSIIHMYIYMARLLGVRGGQSVLESTCPFYTLGSPLYDSIVYIYIYIYIYIYNGQIIVSQAPLLHYIGGGEFPPGSYSTVSRKQCAQVGEAWSTVTYAMLVRKRGRRISAHNGIQYEQKRLSMPQSIKH